MSSKPAQVVDTADSAIWESTEAPFRDVSSSMSHTLTEIDADEADGRSQAISQEQVRAQRLADYLQNVVQSGSLTQDMAELAWNVWNELHAVMDHVLRVPSACPGPDNQLMYTWRSGDHYLELEIFLAGPAEFFYKNRRTGELWEYDYTVGDPVPQAVKDKLHLFLYA